MVTAVLAGATAALAVTAAGGVLSVAVPVGLVVAALVSFVLFRHARRFFTASQASLAKF